jgi:hypothetical protein
MVRTFWKATALATAAVMVWATAALADNVQNDVGAGGNGTITAGGSTTINYRITANSGDGQAGCNAADSTPATVTINAPSGVTATPGSLTFTSCSTDQAVVFSSSSVGDHEVTVSVSDSGPGTYNTSPAKFTLHVNVAPNTAPTVSVTGVTHGATYEAGSVPAAGCSVVDAEDGNSTFAATLSAITGPLSAYGLGSQTATCSYTDAGGLTDSASATYSIQDTTDPVITFVSRLPAANAFGWNKTDVTVTWSCSDAGSGVVNATVSDKVSAEGAGQSATGTCEDNAGNSASDTVTGISIDKTAPSVSLVGGPADGASYYFGSVPAAPACAASDSLSGLAGTCSVSGYGTGVGNHTVTASATDKAGNNASVSATYTVLAWTLNGFDQPVDMGSSMWNTVKGGSTVPLKFEVFAGLTELTDVAVVDKFVVKGVACPTTGYVVDDIELTTTGGTSLRYDATAGQFIQNWQTPKKPGACYEVSMLTDDGSSLSANFKLK